MPSFKKKKGKTEKGERNNKETGKTMNKFELFVFGFIIVYVVFFVLQYLKAEPIRAYEVTMGTLASAKNYTGIAIREEEIITSPYNGYINFFVREGDRISTRDVVYSIDESGRLSDYINQNNMGEDNYTNEELSDIKSCIVQYDKGFNQKNFESVYDFKYDLQGDVVKLVNQNMYEGLKEINKSSLREMVNLCTTGKTGYVVYCLDGMENISDENITNVLFDQSTYEKKRINNNDLVEANSPIGKIITNEKWSVIIQIDEKRAAELEQSGYVKVKFVKNQEESWAEVNIIRKSDGVYAKLSFTNSCVTFCRDRFVELELILNDEEGLKIPNSAIAEKEFFIIPVEYMSKEHSNEKYGVQKESYNEKGEVEYTFIETIVYNSDDEVFFVDDTNLKVGDYICIPESKQKMAVSKKGKLIGVYNMNKGYADFKQITILYQNEEYSIVSSNTKYGLTVYDRIVLDASSVNTEDFTTK